MFSSFNYENFDNLVIPFEKIASATDKFAEENLIAQGTCVKVYKGQLLESGELINIVARKSQQMDVLTKELVMSEICEHEYIVAPFKISAGDDGEVIIINKYEANGSLDKHLHGSTPTWMQRLRICIGVAVALSYIHGESVHGHSVIHGNIKSSKILLDDNWESKLQGFGYSMIVKWQHLYLTSKYNGTLEYMDPAYEVAGGLTHKSDVFSFGVVLFEVLFGRKASNPIPNEDNWFFARLARLHCEKKTMKDMIDPDLWKQMDLQSFKIFSETAYCCLEKNPKDRPDMDQIVKNLEKALELQQKHENPELSSVKGKGTSSNHLKGKSFEHLKIPYSDILLATENFSQKYVIGSGGYGMVYKAELEHFDSKNYLVVEGENKCNLPKKRNTVAIKQISKREDTLGEQGFFTEIETLTSCKHDNIVSLLGFCDEGPQMILVYEHVSNGSLDDYLRSSYKITNLTWGRRIRICLDIAHGLMYLHSSSEGKQKIIHRDIKSANILLDDNWKAKIADFGLSKLHPKNHASTLNTGTIAGTELYLDPEYRITGKLKKESDIYSFGVVLFEILCGRLAYDETYYIGDEKGLPSVARQLFKEGRLMAIVDPKIKGADKNIFMLNRGANQNSLDTFSKIANQCLAETQAERPTMEVVIKELEKAFSFQDSNKDKLQISLEDIKLATQNFSDDNCIVKGMYWKQYKGGIPNANGCTTVVVKRWDRDSDKGKYQFFAELKVLYEQKHENIVVLVGYCNEMDERIIVYEYAANERLSKHLNNACLTWMKRLKICIDIATGLEYLHGGDVKEAVIHRDIKSSSILLDGDWKARLFNLEVSSRSWECEKIEHVTEDNAYDTLGYVDPKYKQGFLTEDSDIYSLGVVLFEILCGRLAWGDGCEDPSHSLGPMAIRHYEDENLNELVFEGIKEQIDRESFTTFADIAVECLDDDEYERPTASEVAIQLKKALELQEDKEIWEPKLPRDYKEILSMSKIMESGKRYTKKDIYYILCKGMPLRDSNMNLSIGSNEEKNCMISSRKFSYTNRWALNWRHIPQSRFQKVAEMLSVSDLKINIKIKMRTQFLSPDVNYGVHLVFKFCSPRKVSRTLTYVNLTYKMKNKTLHAYFATWRDQEWMTIELYRFFNHKDQDTNSEVILESFSRHYCGKGAIYIEGVEFRVVNNVIKHEPEKVHRQLPIYYRKYYMLPAKRFCHNASDLKSFRLKPSAESRFEEAIDLLPRQVFDIKCGIYPYLLTHFTIYECYLVFKLSKKCHGLHCPVKVKDLCRSSEKKTKFIYFRPQSEWNLHDTNQVPKERKDGWMEVIVWKFNSYMDYIDVNLKLITCEGTMSGLIVYGLEFRPTYYCG